MVTIQKDQLAKLLATENVTVQHSVRANTASFDLKNRVLTLPILKYTDEDIVDMMQGHEVGHALYTDEKKWMAALLEEGVHKQILNVVEDARIEKKIKRKYPGIVKNFISGYTTLYTNGFFGDEANSPTELHLVDRINLHYKLGFTAAIPFDVSEEWAITAIDKIETFEDAVRVTKMLQMAHVESTTMSDHGWGDGEEFEFGPNKDGDEESDESAESADGTDEEGEEESGQSPDPAAFDQDDHAIDDEEEFSTEEAFERNKENLQDNKSDEYVYFNLPKAELKSIIVPYKQISKDLTGYIGHHVDSLQGDFNKFRRDSQKIINYMVKEFERRKAANEHRRVSIAKTGILDVNKLHSYRFNEDIFLKNTIMPDGKNHGLVMLVDWSASMTHNMDKTLQQILNLVWFCQKVNIPFEVYAFTNAYRGTRISRQLENPGSDDDRHQQVREIRRNMKSIFSSNAGDLYMRDNFNLFQFLSSRMSARELTKMAKILYTMGVGMQYRYHPSRRFGSPVIQPDELHEYSLSSTPLVEGLMAMVDIIPLFQRTYKLHKTNLMVLTDGDANTGWDGIMRYNETGLHSGSMDGYGMQSIYQDPYTHKTYLIKDMTKYWTYKYQKQVVFLLRILRDRYGINTIGIFLDNASHGKTVKRKLLETHLGWYSMNKEAHMKVRQGIKKDGFATIINSAGYNEYYIVPCGSMGISNDGLHGVDENTTKGKLKTAFMKSQKNKFGSRILADRMLSLII
jgi:hypothetical protein